MKWGFVDFWGVSGDFLILAGKSGYFFLVGWDFKSIDAGFVGEMVIKLLVIVIIVTGVSFLGFEIDSGTRVVVVLECFGVGK